MMLLGMLKIKKGAKIAPFLHMAGDVPTSLCIPIIRDSQSAYPRSQGT
ncbi:protein of unknown function [Shewanella benthica]|uniref:Uncharacterized protein n=1 Tax=Shewanella benthica TaxID=43661 RepID=A0A330LX64_9GAMM|nr:protein of unknown function [Shewanella benthica]